MADKTIQLIVVKCAGNNQVYGDRLVDAPFTSLVVAKSLGEMARMEGWCCIIRPAYNEEDEKGRFFREWRSFNGEPFKECRWSF